MADGLSGIVLETMNSGGYTYVQLDRGNGKVWLAAPETEVKVGEKAAADQGMLMTDFHSGSLDRTFPEIFFVQELRVGNVADARSVGAGSMSGGPAAKAFDFSGISKAEGGYTVEEVFAEAAQLKGREIKVRGIAVKFNPQIMGRNWVHLQDGTGAEGSNDLVVTTQDTVQAGDRVLVAGKLAQDVEGSSFHKSVYKVLLEDAKIVLEQRAAK